MSFDKDRARQHLRSFDLQRLFIETLGWDRPSADVRVELDGAILTLKRVAEKRGVAILLCPPAADSRMPNYPTRRKIDRLAHKQAHEHLIIFYEEGGARHIWQWVRRAPGQPERARELEYVRGQKETLLLQKMQEIAFTLNEEEELSLMGVITRLGGALDTERVTKRFYDRFKSEHDAFLGFLVGIPDEGLQRWYVSVTLNRLMFVYFVQKKQFLDGDADYLRTKLSESQRRGADRYYGQFLCPLFFEGFAVPEAERSPEARRLLGRIPYLNGGIFARHQLEERYGQAIQIADEAFEQLYAFFDAYRWNLDERPLRADNEINPDVLGYIFEKYINQKQMGAYYTKEDITGYITKYTVLPHLLDRARGYCRNAFEGEHSVWDLLQADPDRYIYPAVRHGVDEPLPAEIAEGLDTTRPNLLERRKGWNARAPEAYALPTEIWREVVARRQRYEQVWFKLVNGELRSANDLITYNLDIQQFAQDVVESAEGPELLRAVWRALSEVKILDPTVGSGAFLFAALNILEPLYEACLERMQGLVDELDRSGAPQHPNRLAPFRDVLADAARHPNRRYYILKTIIVQNLYGVDIMEEAVEICKLRLFLKLVAQVARAEEIEPLPDIDFNIRAGNTLVGFTTFDEVRAALKTTREGQAVQDKMLEMMPDVEQDLNRIEEQAEIADRAYQQFQLQQVEKGYVTAEHKAELRARLGALNQELHRALARTYGMDPDGPAYGPWLASHKPFHWLADFYGIMHAGGFDVIIGNPPYVEYSKVKRDYVVRGYGTETCGNLYAFMMERALSILTAGRRLGVIVPLSFVSTDGFAPLRVLYSRYRLWTSNYAIRPAKLFEGVEHRLTIAITSAIKSGCSVTVHGTRYRKWSQDERSYLLDLTNYADVQSFVNDKGIPKLGSDMEISIWRKLSVRSRPFRMVVSDQSRHRMYYTRKFGHFVLFTDFVPSIRFEDGSKMDPTELKWEGLESEDSLLAYIACFNSTLAYWHLTKITDCRNLNKRDVLGHPVPLISASEVGRLSRLGKQLMLDFGKNASYVRMTYPNQPPRIIEVIHPGHSRLTIDEIDRVLAQHYGFTEEELDFIINYDIKYRMGDALESEEDSE